MTPRLPLRLLRARLGDEDAEAVAGDLLERWEADRVRRGAVRAGLTLWIETIAAVLLLPRRRRDSLRGDSRMRSFAADLRHAARLLRRAPGFAVVAVATIALAIASSTVAVGVADPLLFRPLPYPDPERVVTVWERDRDGGPSNVGWQTYHDLSAGARALEYAAALGDWQPTVTGRGDAERVDGQRVSWSYFRVLGARPALGRDFRPDEDTPATRNVVILSHGLWARRFGRDPAIVGGTVSLDGRPYAVAGVMPADFDNVPGPRAQIWRVLGYDETLPQACRTCRHLRMLARLRADATREGAEAELARVSALLARDHPKDYPAVGVRVVGLAEKATERVRPILYAVLGAVALVLLLAVSNLASLQLARALRRETEFSVRAALGAGPGRIAQQLAAEGLLVSLLGGAAGLALAAALLPALVARLPEGLPRVSAMRLDVRAGVLALLLTLAAGLLAGLAPLAGSMRVLSFEALRGGTRVAGPRRRLARAALVVAEVALALVLLVGAGLLGRTLLRLSAVDVGFEPSHLLTMEVQATGPAYETDAQVFANHDRLLAAVRAVRGVEDAGLASQLPLAGNIDRYGVHAEDKPLANPELAPSGDRYVVSADFLRAMRITLVRGRGFSAAEAADSVPRVVLVSASLARRIWPGEDAIGKRIRVGGPDGPARTVVGVVGDVRHTGLDEAVSQQLYFPERQWRYAESQMALVVRTRGDPAALAPAVRAAVRSVDPSQPVIRLTTMERLIAATLAQRTLALVLFGAFAAVALVMAAAGIYGVLSGAVAERAPEIGLRMALGATPAATLRRVLGDGGRLAVAGVLAGAGGALAVGRLLRGLLYGVEPADVTILSAAAALLLAIAAAACLVPALRAARTDPMRALRGE
ncbi:MAG: ADOP family duplicated permease [Gemmatimonadaceae bacterium]